MISFVKKKGYNILVLMLRFHKLVTRCYCPSTEVAKRAKKAGLETSQIKVYGLPVRPSFVKPVRPKVGFIKFPFLTVSCCFEHPNAIVYFQQITGRIKKGTRDG